ncbi:MAG TPA: zf-TFIIB domain-containing protein [Nannocystaceae bacterium]|nr:zf-TFIIB domain-containing protein [Nannocystaceae bacterium]
MSRRAGEQDNEIEIRQELAKRREQARLRHSQLRTDERDRLKLLHWMRCPKCGAELSEVQFRSVKVDKCFNCGGVYLDDGELEQLTGKPGWFEGMLRFFRGV